MRSVRVLATSLVFIVVSAGLRPASGDEPVFDPDLEEKAPAPVSETVRPVPADYDGDGKVDVASFVIVSFLTVERIRDGLRIGDAAWFVRSSQTGQLTVTRWGGLADLPVPGDYDGDGKADLAVFRNSFGGWFVRLSSGGTQTVTNWGLPFGDEPVPADYDGDRKTDIAIFRRGEGTWFIRQSTTGQPRVVAGFGMPSTGQLVPGDYDGDGKADVAIYQPSSAQWYILRSSDGNEMSVNHGSLEHVAAPADYDGDGKIDIAVFRDGVWSIGLSSTGIFQSATFAIPGAIPIPADYDGDGRADLAFHSPLTGLWSYFESGSGQTRAFILSGNGILQQL